MVVKSEKVSEVRFVPVFPAGYFGAIALPFTVRETGTRTHVTLPGGLYVGRVTNIRTVRIG